MGCSYKAGIITIAVITIIFAGLNLTKVARDIHRHNHHHHHHGGHHGGQHHHEHHHGKHGHHHGHQHHKHHEEGRPYGDDDIAVPEWNEKDEKVPEIAEKRDEDIKDKRMNQPHPVATDQDWKPEEEDKFGEKDPYKWGNHRAQKIGRIVVLVADVISIITSVLIFAVVTEDVGKNQRRRHMILPYIIWHLLCIFLMFVGCIFAMIVFKDYMGAMAIPLIILGISICISILFVTIAIQYFKSLAKGAGFAYAQMDDMVKKPLA